MNILSLEDNIKSYIQNNLSQYVADAGLTEIDSYIDDFMDLDKYKQNTLLFYDFTNFHFEPLSLKHHDMSLAMHIFFVLRGNDSATLKRLIVEYTDTFYKFFYDQDKCNQSFNGLVDLGIITDVELYNAALGNQNIKVADITISLKLEDI